MTDLRGSAQGLSSVERASARPDPATPGFERIPVLDGWRGLAILAVILHNTSGPVPTLDALPVKLLQVALQAGWVGVTLFFVLSGYLITGILFDSVGRPNYLRNFYIRRTLRIFPLYYGFLVAMAVVAPLVAGGDLPEQLRGESLFYWLYLSNWHWLVDAPILAFSHLWSLAVEEQFYLAWPLLVWAAGERRFAWVAGAIVVSALGIRFLLQSLGQPEPVLYTWTFARMDALALGSLLAVVLRRPAWVESVGRHRLTILGAATAAVVAVMVEARGLDPLGPLEQSIGQTVVAFWFTAALLVTLRPGNRWERASVEWLSIGALRSLGKYSYAMYLFHFPIVTMLRDPLGARTAASDFGTGLAISSAYVLGVLAVTYVLAFGSWHLFEKHFLKLKDRWAPRVPVQSRAGAHA